MPRNPVIIFIVLLIWLQPIDGARSYIVDDDGFANYKTIQEAVIAANNGDTIYVKPGNYHEEVVLNKSVSLTPLIGEREPIILKGDGKETGITITSDGCSLEGLTFENFTGPGIHVRSNGNTIKENAFEKDNPAILVRNSHMNSIAKNVMKNCEGGVALLANSSNNNVLENEIIGGTVAILIRDAGKNSIIGNSANGSSMGIWLMNSSNSEIIGNEIGAKTYGIWIFNSTSGYLRDNAISRSLRGMYFMNCSGQEIENNSIKNVEFGIALENSNWNAIAGCSIENSTRAFGLAKSRENIISGNRIREVKDTAIEVDYSSGNSLQDNEISRGDKGIIMLDSSANLLKKNQFQEIKWSLYVESSTKEGFNNSIDESNLVDGAPVAYIYGKSGGLIQNKKLAHITLAYCDNVILKKNDVTNDAIFLFNSNQNKIQENNVSNCYGIRMVNSTGNWVLGNHLQGNRYSGMFMVSSNSNQIVENTASGNNQNGISLLDCNNNTLRGNVVDHNYETGVWLNYSNDNQIYQNNFTNNPLGLQIIYSSGNQIYHNNFVNNKEHSQDMYGNNSWDGGDVIGGNYWSGHVAKGNPSENWPMIIKGGKTDKYPFQDESGWLLEKPK